MDGRTGMAWHYTTGQCFALIVREGRILPMAARWSAPERPVAWFSVHPYVEPTAVKVMVLGGRPHELTIGETYRAGAGLYRFGVPAAELVPADAIREAAGYRRAGWKALIGNARRHGADPWQWYAALEPVALDRCTVERLDACPPHGAWQPVPDPKAWAEDRLVHELRAAWDQAEASRSEGAA